MKRISILGSTGSIGRQCLDVVEALPGRFEIVALAAGANVSLVIEQILRHRPAVVSVANEECARALCSALESRAGGERKGPLPEILFGAEGIERVATHPDAEIVLSATVGVVGLPATFKAIEYGKDIALANKEVLVAAGEVVMGAVARRGVALLPVDSEHNAIHQCLRGGERREVRRLVLTASGGPFRETPIEQLERVTPEQALNHPTWKMGKRITIDSATLMNKGLEVIEARWLFDIGPEKIDIIVHPQSVVHSMVEFVDGSIVAQLGTADMRQPIQYALTYPDRLESSVAALDWASVSRLDFHPPDRQKFPCVGLAYRAIEMGGTAPAVLNAADEVAVDAFLAGKIPFSDIPKLIGTALECHKVQPADSVDSILKADAWARDQIRRRVSN